MTFMNTKYIFGGVFLLFIILIYGCAHQPSLEVVPQESPQQPSQKSAQSSQEPLQSEPSETQEQEQSETQEPKTENQKMHNVEIKGFSYIPAEIRIKKGDTVVWTNNDPVKHTVTSDSGAELDSNLLNEGESYVHIFNEAGIYEYHCRPHPYMKGKVIVE